jgi:hypothetical protein
MSRRVAVLMKLRDGVTKAEVRELCDLLRKIGDPSSLLDSGYDEERIPDPSHPGRQAVRFKDRPRRPKKDEEIVQTYDDEHGDPVFYIP